MTKVTIDGREFIAKDELIDKMVDLCVENEEGCKDLITCNEDEIAAIDRLIRVIMRDEDMYFEFKKRYLRRRYGALLPRNGV